MPAPGSRQPVGGFSALLDAPVRDRFYAMPDNGFGTKASSRSFLLRVYRVGLGDPFKMPYITIESVLAVGRGRLAIVNDTNFGSRGRNPGLPDCSDFIVVDAPGVPSG